MVGVNHTTAAQTHDGIGEEIIGGDKRILDGRVGQLAVAERQTAGKHLSGAVPLLVDVAVMLDTAVEAVDQHQGQFVPFLRHGGRDDEITLAGSSADVKHALVIESCAKHAHVDSAAEGVIAMLQLFQHRAGTTLVKGVQIGNDCGDALVQFRTVLTQGLQILLHIRINLSAMQSQSRIGVHQQIHVEDEILVTHPQMACLAEKAHTLLHLDGIDGAQCGGSHDHRGGRCATKHLTVPHENVPVLEQVKVIHLVAMQEQVQRLAIQAVLRVSFQLLKTLLAVPSNNAQVILVVFIVKEQLHHIQGVRHQALVHASPTQVVIAKLLESVLHQVKLRQRAGDSSSRILAQAAIGILDAGDVIIGVWTMPYPILIAVLGRVIAV